MPGRRLLIPSTPVTGPVVVALTIGAGAPFGFDGAPAGAGHGLQLQVRELAAFTERRGAGKHQVDGLCRLLYRLYPHIFGKLRSQLLLRPPWGPPAASGGTTRPVGSSLRASVPSLPTAAGRFGHGPFSFLSLPNRFARSPWQEAGRICQMHHCCLKLFIYRYNLERKSIILE